MTRGVAPVMTNTGSLENVTVSDPLAMAVPMLVSDPAEFNSYTVSPTVMRGSVKVSVIGAVAVGDVVPDSQETATDVT